MSTLWCDVAEPEDGECLSGAVAGEDEAQEQCGVDALRVEEWVGGVGFLVVGGCGLGLKNDECRWMIWYRNDSAKLHV